MCYIKKIVINNYKCFEGEFTLELADGINIIVGDNAAGKSTILEAIYLALSGQLNGRYLRNELSQYLFNREVEKTYINNLKTNNSEPLPYISIEVFFCDGEFPLFEGDGNSARTKQCGVCFKIEFDSQYQADYEELVKSDVKTIPMEYYKTTWTSFSRDFVVTKTIPIKTVLIDSSSVRYQNGSDVYISKIIQNDLEDKEIIDLSQAYRKFKESFMKDKSIEAINEKITEHTNITNKKVTISVDLSARNAWESVLMTYVDNIPFPQIGKGEQCIIKTNLALAHERTQNSNLILIEEPENHLTHVKLNQFIKNIKNRCRGKQIIVTTHSNFVANKLGLKNLILLNDHKTMRLANLEASTYEYFEKLPGFNTLRMLLCEKAILVEGPSDELIIQRAYMDKHNDSLPIEKGIDVISVGLSFERFLEIAKLINKPVAVVRDNDGSYEKNVEDKYAKYKEFRNIKICENRDNQLNTLEPYIINANNGDLSGLCAILGKEESKIKDYMLNNKTDYALKIFDSASKIMYPQYINEIIGWCDE